MKKFLPLLISFFLFAGLAKAQYVTIPDAAFRSCLQQEFPSCFNSSGMMDTTCSEILSWTNLNFLSSGNFSETANQIQNLDGIQYFKSLTNLDGSLFSPSLNSIPAFPNSLDSLSLYLNSTFKHLPAFPNSLKYLYIENIPIDTLPALPDSLAYLHCHFTNITSLPALPHSLTYLDCAINGLSVLPDLPTSLTYLSCSENVLTGLPTLPASLTSLSCNYNLLTSLPTLPASLTSLSCNYNLLTSLPTLPASLTFLSCNTDSIKSLPSLPNSLTSLDCSLTQITSLPALPNSLTYLNCYENPEVTLPTLPESLAYLNCGYSKNLRSLPALPNSLTYLDCDRDSIASLPVPLPGSLSYLDCSHNILNNLPALPNSLTYTNCNNNHLVGLPVLSNSLVYLDCSQNQIVTMPALPNSLTALLCYSNSLTGLPALPNSLDSLVCHFNNIYCLPQIPNLLQLLSIDTSKIKCLPNSPYYIAILNAGMLGFLSLPLCNPTNNINHCQEFPLMVGTAFYDNNSNGIKDAGEFFRPNIRLQLSNGTSTFTNSNGYYEIAALDGLGSYTLSAYAPQYYKAVPVLMNYTFNSFDTLVSQSIALQPTVVIDTLSINLNCYQWRARPGFALPYVINYSNIGTTTLSPTITFNYDNTLLTYDSSSVAGVVNNGSSLSLTQSNFVPGQSGSFVAYFTTKTTDTIGATIKSYVTIAANATSTKDSAFTDVSSSFDPNDKEATQQLTPQEVANGKPINYTIRFQNTGNDTAFNIVIADTLSSLLNDTTLQMISSSSPCKVTVTGNVVFFEFLNVQLPDSNVNKIGSNGYLSFSVQPQASVSSGSISNTASIYFDYNAPVVTNTAVTQIGTDGTVPVKLISFTALTQAGTNDVLLYWSTAQEINTKSFIVEQSSDGINFTPMATVTAKGTGANTYTYNVGTNTSTVYYKIKMVDNDGQFSYSSIINIKNIQSNEGIVLLNNPVKDWMTIKINATALNNSIARVINSQGALVKNFVLYKGIQAIDVSELPSGAYYIQTQLASLKIIISR